MAMNCRQLNGEGRRVLAALRSVGLSQPVEGGQGQRVKEFGHERTNEGETPVRMIVVLQKPCPVRGGGYFARHA